MKIEGSLKGQTWYLANQRVNILEMTRLGRQGMMAREEIYI